MEDLLKVCRRARAWAKRHPRCEDGDLLGWCGICSLRIFSSLRWMGKKPRFVMINNPYSNNESHCAVLCDDYLLDVTATQFDMPRSVYVVPKIELEDLEYDRWFWNYRIACFIGTTTKSIKKQFKYWPCEQDPFRFNKLS